jgi:hypothetical protein
MSTNAFTQMGNTVAFIANVTAPTAVQAISYTPGGNQYRIINVVGGNLAFLGYGTTATQAANNSVVVTTAGPALPLLPGTDEILTFVPNAYFTATTSSGNSTIYITPGDGM